MFTYADPHHTTAQVADIVRPARRMKPSQAATHFKLRDKEGRDWSPELSPYIVEPLDQLGERRYQGIAFLGPARTSKTFGLVHGAINYIVNCDPGDTTLVQMSRDTARSFSHEEIDPVIRKSEGLASRLSPLARNNNTFDKVFRSGMTLNIGWPAVTQVSGKTRKYVVITDYDRPENRDNVDGEGPLWDLGAKRVTTYMSRGKCLAESSPGEDTMDPKFIPLYPHQAPPASGLTEIYNRGTMARWYWRCLHCGTRMQAEPGTAPFRLPEFKELRQIVTTTDLFALSQEYARLTCTTCGGVHLMADRPAMQRSGKWLHSGEAFDKNDEIIGERRNTPIASYWLGGVAAAFQRWDSMLLGYFEAVRTYNLNGDESPLRARTNLDFGASYMPRAAANRRKAEDLIQRAEHWAHGIVPEGVRYLTAAVDVQKHRFVVSVFGWGEGQESWVVDRFTLSHSPTRRDPDRPEKPAVLDPATYLEDWKVLGPEVISRSYPLAEAPGVRMEVYVTACDTGGAASEDEEIGGGVTVRAYDYWRSLKGTGLQNRLKLIKGANSPDAPRFQERYPDAKDKVERHARGDVPVWFLNTTIFKDAIVGDLGNEKFGPGYVHLPDWLPKPVFAEWVAESRTDKGWKKTNKRGNEQFDLHGYNRALVAIIDGERIQWHLPDRVPAWARRPLAVAATTVTAASPATTEMSLTERRRLRAQQLNG